jgi:putative acetyltransferase
MNATRHSGSPRAGAVEIRPATAADRTSLLALWERSVRATHDFLTERDIVALRPLVAAELAMEELGWWVLRSDRGAPVGMLAFSHDTIGALFLDPEHRGRGMGRLLVDHAQRLSTGTLSVDVNEQNVAAMWFYGMLGFETIGRSPVDDGGRPFPIVHMRRA